MGEILGLGMTHYPGLVGPDENFTAPLRFVLSDPALAETLRTAEGWPEPMRQEWGDDNGFVAAKRHREGLVHGLRAVRTALDEFKPDFIVLWGDDQYENFKEDVMPPFCIMAYESVALRPWSGELKTGSGFWGEFRNAWDESKDKTFVMAGHQSGGKFLSARLLEEGFDVAYAYKPLHTALGHAFLNTFLYLDYDRKGFDYPIVPFQVNCYGSRVIAHHGSLLAVADTEAEPDPPSPMPWRCFDLGGAVARVLTASPWRVALIASSSWSHGTLTAKTHYIHPDVEADREMYDALRDGDYEKWRSRPLSAIEESGHHELLNWFCLVGAMAELGRKPDETDFVESWICNSDKVFAIFRP